MHCSFWWPRGGKCKRARAGPEKVKHTPSSERCGRPLGYVPPAKAVRPPYLGQFLDPARQRKHTVYTAKTPDDTIKGERRWLVPVGTCSHRYKYSVHCTYASVHGLHDCAHGKMLYTTDALNSHTAIHDSQITQNSEGNLVRVKHMCLASTRPLPTCPTEQNFH